MSYTIRYTVCGQRYGRSFKTKEQAEKAFSRERTSARVTTAELWIGNEKIREITQ